NDSSPSFIISFSSWCAIMKTSSGSERTHQSVLSLFRYTSSYNMMGNEAMPKTIARRSLHLFNITFAAAQEIRVIADFWLYDNISQ
ncbi:hypothetical protein, partial [Castellaniella sp.]|uniref:hypothetical protein n=1 Tax=Castellaniella sp. TaxID=1955812 RepID=UPI003C759E1C